MLETETRQKLGYKFQGKYLAYASNNLTNFEYEVNPMTGNGNHVYIRVKPMNLFLTCFSHLEPL